jgi:hypothetical protein
MGVLVLLAAAVPALAVPILVPSTGAGSVEGAAEATWRFRFCGASPTGCVGAFSTPFETNLTAGYPTGFWLPNDATSQWISPQSNYSAFLSDPAGYYQWRLSFDLTGLDPATASLQFRVVSDDPFAGYSLNGAAISGGIPGSGYAAFSSLITVSTGFVPGGNTFDLFVLNAPPNGPNPTGIRVEMNGTANAIVVSPPGPGGSPIPEPSSFVYGSLGLLALGWRWTRAASQTRPRRE